MLVRQRFIILVLGEHYISPASIGRRKRTDTMPPTLALLLWFVLLLALVCFDPAREPGTSLALWVPVTWMFIIGSRLPSQWLGGPMESAAQTYEEGNPLDRMVFSVLIILSVGFLLSRSFKWGDFFARNLAIVTFVSFALVSVFLVRLSPRLL